jgi:hypothetical protein
MAFLLIASFLKSKDNDGFIVFGETKDSNTSIKMVISNVRTTFISKNPITTFDKNFLALYCQFKKGNYLRRCCFSEPMILSLEPCPNTPGKKFCKPTLK